MKINIPKLLTMATAVQAATLNPFAQNPSYQINCRCKHALDVAEQSLWELDNGNLLNSLYKPEYFEGLKIFLNKLEKTDPEASTKKVKITNKELHNLSLEISKFDELYKPAYTVNKIKKLIDPLITNKLLDDYQYTDSGVLNIIRQVLDAIDLPKNSKRLIKAWLYDTLYWCANEKRCQEPGLTSPEPIPPSPEPLPPSPEPFPPSPEPFPPMPLDYLDVELWFKKEISYNRAKSNGYFNTP